MSIFMIISLSFLLLIFLLVLGNMSIQSLLGGVVGFFIMNMAGFMAKWSKLEEAAEECDIHILKLPVKFVISFRFPALMIGTIFLLFFFLKLLFIKEE